VGYRVGSEENLYVETRTLVNIESVPSRERIKETNYQRLGRRTKTGMGQNLQPGCHVQLDHRYVLFTNTRPSIHHQFHAFNPLNNKIPKHPVLQ
jgi:hypothetical protein